MDIKQINSAIMFGSFTDAELASVIDAVKFARTGLQKRTIRQIRLGSRVRWVSNRNPRGESGVVEKIGHKFVTVNTATGLRWRVPANMLSVEA